MANRVRSLSPEAEKWLVDRIEALRQSVQARQALVFSGAGHLMAQTGEADDARTPVLGSLLAGILAASLEVAHQLEEEPTFSVLFHEGDRLELFGAPVDADALVLLIRRRGGSAPRVGAVRLGLRRAVHEIRAFFTALEVAGRERQNGGSREERRRALLTYKEARTLGLIRDS
ncbi:MAG: roadblock/LC7 domain-containing protein [Anaerolineales bacterium]